MQVKHLPFMYRCGFLFICTVFSNLSCDLLSPDEDTVEDVTFVAISPGIGCRKRPLGVA